MASVYPVPTEWAEKAHIDDAAYQAAYARSIADPDGFWRDEAQRIDWITPFTRVKDTSFNEADFRIRWFEDGALNVSANCLDRHLDAHGDTVAIIWEGDDPGQQRKITYRELHAEVSRFANVLVDIFCWQKCSMIFHLISLFPALLCMEK